MKTSKDSFAIAVGTGLGLGYCPWAPGTLGSLWGLLLVCLFPGFRGVIGLAFLIPLGVWAASRCEIIYAKKDSGRIVIDEVCGMWLTCLPFRPRPEILLASFLLFRLWDIVKPPLASQSQSIHGGMGVMADDLIAAIYSMYCLLILHWINLF